MISFLPSPPSPSLQNSVSVAFRFELQLALLAADDFVPWKGFDVLTSVARYSVFLAVSSVILFKVSSPLLIRK